MYYNSYKFNADNTINEMYKSNLFMLNLYVNRIKQEQDEYILQSLKGTMKSLILVIKEMEKKFKLAPQYELRKTVKQWL